MTTLALLNGKRYSIKENFAQVTYIIKVTELEYVELTLVTDEEAPGPAKLKEVKANFMKHAIAYWY